MWQTATGREAEFLRSKEGQKFTSLQKIASINCEIIVQTPVTKTQDLSKAATAAHLQRFYISHHL